jgi:hypothetical protein
MQIGMKVIVGNKYARRCHYDHLVGNEETIVSVYEKINPYDLYGTYTFCGMKSGWEVRIEDCTPVANKNNKNVLVRYDD